MADRWSWKSNRYEFYITQAGTWWGNRYWARLKVYSPKFNHWQEITLRTYPFKTESAAKRFINDTLRGWWLRDSVNEWGEQAGWEREIKPEVLY